MILNDTEMEEESLLLWPGMWGCKSIGLQGSQTPGEATHHRQNPKAEG